MGNHNPHIYTTTPDNRIPLSPKGHKQAKRAGIELKGLTNSEPIGFFLSPALRAQETFEDIRKAIRGRRIQITTDPRLVERELGMFYSLHQRDQVEQTGHTFGPFHYRPSQGESCADVYYRVTTFIDDLKASFLQPDCPPNVCIISHAVTTRMLLTRWFNIPLTLSDKMGHPHNAQIVTMTLGKDGEYRIKDVPKTLNLPYKVLRQRSKWTTA